MRLRVAAVWCPVMAMVLCVVAAAQSPQQQPQQGGCYLPDASGKQVFVPNCGLDEAPQRKAAPAPASGADPAKAFPFPGETNAPAAQAGAAQSGAAPTNATPASGSNPAAAFPFPGEDKTPLVNPDGSIAPAGTAANAPAGSPGSGGLKDAGSSGESSSSSSSSSSSGGNEFGGLPDDSATRGPLADDDTVLKKPHKKEHVAADQTPSEREAEDLNVYGFYMGDGNYRGAYLRAADAVAAEGDDPDAHLALADAARKIGKLDQALVEYKKTLTMDPVPKTKKSAEKALKELAVGS